MYAIQLNDQQQKAREAVLSLNAEELQAMFDRLQHTAVELVLDFCFAYERAMQLGIENDLRIAPSLRRYVRRILGGQLSPDLYAKCQSNLALLQKAQYLPLDDQVRIAGNEPVKVMELNGDHRMVPALSLTRDELKQVFDGDMLADEATQVGKLRRSLAEAAMRQEIEEAANPIRVDKRHKRLIINGVELSAADLARYLAELT